VLLVGTQRMSAVLTRSANAVSESGLDVAGETMQVTQERRKHCTMPAQAPSSVPSVPCQKGKLGWTAVTSPVSPGA
jgi:hypothetical protein